jgi:hypothetical protein
MLIRMTDKVNLKFSSTSMPLNPNWCFTCTDIIISRYIYSTFDFVITYFVFAP